MTPPPDDFQPVVEDLFDPLVYGKQVVLGRSSGNQKRLGRKGLLFLGKVAEGGLFTDSKVMMDGEFPHIIFI